MLDNLLFTMQDKHAANPLWEVELKEIHGGIQTLKRFGRHLLRAATLAALSVAAIVGMNWGLMRDMYLLIVFWSVVGSLIWMLGADAAHSIVTIMRFRADLQSDQWDLLRLTSVESGAILSAKYSGAQLRIWRTVVFEMGWHMFNVLLFALPVMAELLNSPRGLLRLSAELVLMGFTIVALSVIYLYEPFWRMRAVVALSLGIAAKIRQPTFMILAALAIVVGVRLAQLFISICLLIPTIALFRYVFVYGVLSIICSCMIITLWIYEELRGYGLKIALRHAFRSE